MWDHPGPSSVQEWGPFWGRGSTIHTTVLVKLVSPLKLSTSVKAKDSAEESGRWSGIVFIFRMILNLFFNFFKWTWHFSQQLGKQKKRGKKGFRPPARPAAAGHQTVILVTSLTVIFLPFPTAWSLAGCGSSGLDSTGRGHPPGQGQWRQELMAINCRTNTSPHLSGLSLLHIWCCLYSLCTWSSTVGWSVPCMPRGFKKWYSTHKGVNLRSKYTTQVQQQRPESTTVTHLACM